MYYNSSSTIMKKLTISFLVSVLLVSLASVALAQVRNVVTVEGEITCLPHRNQKGGVTTLECAFGLKGRDANHYGLGNLSQDDLMSGKISTGQKVRVTGVLEPDPASRYDIVGTIEVQSIVQLGRREDVPPPGVPPDSRNFSPPGEPDREHSTEERWSGPPQRKDPPGTGVVESSPNRPEGLFQRKQEQITDLKERVEMRRTTVQAQIQAKLKEGRNEIQLKWENRKARLDEQRKQRVRNHVRAMIMHAQNVIDRLAALGDKIEARIKKLGDAGANTATAKTLLATARTKIADAQVALDSAKISLEAAYNAENPGQAMDEAKVVFEEVRKAISEAKQALVDTINSLKGLKVEAEVTNNIE